MIEFQPGKIPGVYELMIPKFEDERGEMRKIYSAEQAAGRLPPFELGETLISRNKSAGVIRGFHFQRPPFAQAKLLYCLEGELLNVVLDIRKSSPAYGQYESYVLSGEKGSVLYLPEGVANAYAIRRDNTAVLYQMTSRYMPEYAGGIRWDSVGVDFGLRDEIVLSQKDSQLPPWKDFITPFN